MSNVSKYNFDEIERRLDSIKFDQGTTKFLRGDGTYAEPTISEPYDDSVILNEITELEEAIQLKADKTELEGLATEDFVTEKIGEAQLSGEGQSVNLDEYQRKEHIGELTSLSTTNKASIVGAINEVKDSVDGKADSATTLAGYGIEDAYTKEEIEEKLLTLPSAPAIVGVEYEDERLMTQDDIKHQSETITFAIDNTGKCTASKEIPDTFTNDKAHFLFGDVYKLDFKIKRNLYWVAIERNPDSGDLLVVGIGKGLTKKLATLSVLAGRIIDLNVQAQDSSISKIFPVDTRVRVYRDTNGTVTFYYKQPSENAWTRWFDVPRKNIYTEKVLGFVPGISGDECKDNFSSDKNILFEDMKIQRTEPFPFARNFDIRLANLELASTTV